MTLDTNKTDGRRNKAESAAEIRLRERLEVMTKQFKSKQIVMKDDFHKVGLKGEAITRAVLKLRNESGFDVLTVRRRRQIIGWILAEGVLRK